LDSSAKSIACSLYKIAAIIKSKKLEDKTTTDIPRIPEFGFATWNFILSIYKSGWDKLTTNKDNRLFRQYIVLQFKAEILDDKSNAN